MVRSTCARPPRPAVANQALWAMDKTSATTELGTTKVGGGLGEVDEGVEASGLDDVFVLLAMCHPTSAP